MHSIKLGLRTLLEIAARHPFKHNVRALNWPAREPDDTALTEHIKRWSQTEYHPVGTCAMGIDSMAVVDATLKVRGLECLRVVDASVMPTIPGGNTNAPVIMIAEKASDLIKHKAS